MSLKYFICPDGNKIETKSCLKSCRLGRRCMTKKTLEYMAHNRNVHEPSVTQLFNGPRQNKLMREKAWSINPRKSGFLLLGTSVSDKLDNQDDRMIHNGVSGLPDHFDLEDGTLTDYKTVGSYKAARALGLKKTRVDGKNVWEPSEDRDIREYSLQLNKYRLMLIAQGHKVTSLQIQAILRDGGTYGSVRQGFSYDSDNIILIPIPIMHESEVEAFFLPRAREFREAMESEEMPRLCNEVENWDGRKCQHYCPVKEFCAQAGDNPYITSTKEKDDE